MNGFVGNFLQNKFYACCYILLSGTRLQRRCTPICGAAMYLIIIFTKWIWLANSFKCFSHGMFDLWSKTWKTRKNCFWITTEKKIRTKFYEVAGHVWVELKL